MVLLGVAGALGRTATSLTVLTSAGVLRPYGLRAMVGISAALMRWGVTPAGGFVALAAREPHRVGLVDELGELTWRELHLRTNAIAHALNARGIGPGDRVAVMCRNHRGFVESVVGITKTGADVLLINTGFAGPQLAEVAALERPRLLVHDQEFTCVVSDVEVEHRVVAWVDDEGTLERVETLEEWGMEYANHDPAPPRSQGKVVVLTSGTTGAPKGAARQAGLGAGVALLSRLPLRQGWRCHIAAPLFHSWGFAHLALSMLLGTTVVLRRRFEPEQVLRLLEDERCDSVVVTPVMLQRMLEVGEDVLASVDLSHVRVVATSGSALPGGLAHDWMDRFGEHLYNTYGSTEVAYAAVAGPRDLRLSPGTAGRPPWSTTLRILDDDGQPLPDGHTGRIFVGNGMLFDGYTSGETKEVIGGLMSTGDLGWVDRDGRLFVNGREDEMIVSGGENVFPGEVENCLAAHPAVAEAAVLGVEDEEFGQRLRAFIVLVSPQATREDELKEHVRANLAGFKVPREIVVLDELPRNETGKILKREL